MDEDKIYYEHYRIPDYIAVLLPPKGLPPTDVLMRYRRGVERWEPSTRGGLTVCILRLRDGATIRGEALCSLSDNFNYKAGRELAYRRAAQDATRLLGY